MTEAKHLSDYWKKMLARRMDDWTALVTKSYQELARKFGEPVTEQDYEDWEPWDYGNNYGNPPDDTMGECYRCGNTHGMEQMMNGLFWFSCERGHATYHE